VFLLAIKASSRVAIQRCLDWTLPTDKTWTVITIFSAIGTGQTFARNTWRNYLALPVLTLSTESTDTRFANFDLEIFDLSFSFLAPWNNLSKVFVWTVCIADSDLLSKSFWDWWLFLRRHWSSSLSPQGLCLFVIFKDYYLDENKVRYNFNFFVFFNFFVKELIRDPLNRGVCAVMLAQ